MLHSILKNINDNKSNDLKWIAVVFIVVVVMMMTIPLFGIPSGNDLTQHFQFAEIYYDSILSGNFFPGWSAHENYGFGAIGIRFYPPLAYYALAFGRILTGNWYEAGWLVFSFWMLLGCIGIYLWSKEFLSAKESAVAASLFAFAPYHLAQIYQFFIYAEFAGCAVLPFCFLFVTRVCRQGKLVDILCLAVSYTLLILTHIPLTIIGSISLGVYALVILDWKQFNKTAMKLALSFGLGLSASSFHWIKIVTEMNWLNHASPRFSTGYYDYQTNFFPLYFSSPANFEVKLLWLIDVIFIFSILFILPGLVYLILKRDSKDTVSAKFLRAIVITGLFAGFMSSSLSAFLWKMLPVLQKIQFPWRWLSVVSIVGSICFGAAIPRLIQQHIKFKRLIIYSVVLLMFAVMLFNFTQTFFQSAQIPREDFELKISNLQNDEGFDCWWTIWSKRQAFDNKEKVSAGSRKVVVETWKNELKLFAIEAGDSPTARIAIFYYPYWQAEVNGKAVEIQRADDGTILIPLSNEESVVQLTFTAPFIEKFCFAVSVLAWCLITILLTINFRQKSNRLRHQ